jgi:hypothetical protein
MSIWSKIEEEKLEGKGKELLREKGEVDVEDQELNIVREVTEKKNKYPAPPKLISLLRPLLDDISHKIIIAKYKYHI